VRKNIVGGYYPVNLQLIAVVERAGLGTTPIPPPLSFSTMR